MPIEKHDGATVITGANSIRYAQLCALKGLLSLEIKGLKRRGTPASQIVRNTTGLTQRNKAKLLVEFEAYIANHYPDAAAAQ